MTDPGQYRYSGMWGSAWYGHQLLMDMIEVNAALEIGRIAVPLVGTQNEGQKQGRNTREGTISIQKIDARWEWFVWNFSSKSVEQRRTQRDAGKPFDPSFDLLLKYDDPEALGVERWQLNGVRMWRLTLGFSLNDELVVREYPITWVSETPITAFKRTVVDKDPAPLWLVGHADKPGNVQEQNITP